MLGIVVEIDLPPDGDPRKERKGRTHVRRDAVQGPFDRRITAARRISVTGLEGLKNVDLLCVHASPNLLRLTTQLFLNVPVVKVRKTRAGRLELDFTRDLRSLLVDADLDPRDGQSIQIDVFRISRGQHLELECVRRGKGRPI